MVARFGPRFGAESAFIIAVAVVAALLELSWPLVAAAVFVAWAVVAAVEIAVSGAGRSERARSERELESEPSLYTPTAPEPELPVAGEPLFEEQPETTAVAEAPATRLTTRLSEAPPPVPEPPAVGVTPPTPSAFPELRPSASRQWNLWELERRAREVAGRDPVRDEEWSFLLMYLREFADADGMLSADFDPLVRESFSDLLGRER